MTLFTPFSFTEGKNENIWNAFRKSAVWPINLNAVTDDATVVSQIRVNELTENKQQSERTAILKMEV
jgi:hypothetical protein